MYPKLDLAMKTDLIAMQTPYKAHTAPKCTHV